MQTELTQAIIQKVPMLSESDQKKVLEAVENLLSERDSDKGKRISEIFDELSNQVSLEEWEELPSDGAENHDHYLYGASKITR